MGVGVGVTIGVGVGVGVDGGVFLGVGATVFLGEGRLYAPELATIMVGLGAGVSFKDNPVNLFSSCK